MPDGAGPPQEFRCPECGRVASVPAWVSRPICVHAWEGCAPEVWDGDDVSAEGRPIEESPNEKFRSPSPSTWTEMEPLDLRALLEAREGEDEQVVHGNVCPSCGTIDTGHLLDPPAHCGHPYELYEPIELVARSALAPVVEEGEQE